jgi:ABC-type antimicrobial peptide transport system permease subunit
MLAIGIGTGLPPAWAGSGLIDSWLFGLSRMHPRTAVVSALVKLATGLAAAYLPAWRASRIDPLTALRRD